MIEILSQNSLIILFFFLIALLYSSVGFGGGSSYLAVLAISGLLYTQIRSISLMCNIIVVTSNVLFFIRQKQYNWYRILPLIILSIPLSFLGGYLKLSQEIFFVLLGIILLIAAFTMWFSNKIVNSRQTKNSTSYIKNSVFGGGIGFLSGLVGIGGGIFLSPLLHLTYWDTPKRIAAVSSLFILVNSVSGLTGQILNSDFVIDWNFTSILLLVVLLGSLIGNKLRNSLFSPIFLKKATAILIAFVSIRILIPILF